MFMDLGRKAAILCLLTATQLFGKPVALSGTVTLSEESVQELADSMRQASQRDDSSENECCPTRRVNRNVTPSARGCLGNCGFYTTADFLYWQATETDLWITFKNTVLTNPNRNGEYKRIGFDWEPGFRAGLGWNPSYDGWDIFANYTWYLNNSSEVVTSPISLPVGLTSLLVPNISGNVLGINSVLYGRAKANWRLNYNFFDLELGRSFYLSRTLSLRPFLGAKGGWLNRKLEANYSNGLVVITGGGFTINTRAMPANYSGKANIWGVGPRLGIEGDWGFLSHFFLYGDFSGSILYGMFNNTFTTTQSNNAAQTALLVVHTIEEGWRAFTNLQLLLGLGWGSCFNCNRNYFSLKAGWEINQWYNLDRFLLFNATTPLSTNISLQGLTLSAKLDF